MRTKRYVPAYPGPQYAGKLARDMGWVNPRYSNWRRRTIVAKKFKKWGASFRKYSFKYLAAKRRWPKRH